MKSITIDKWDEVPRYYTGHIIHTHLNQAWLKNGKFHREDGPAVIWPNGTQKYYLNDELFITKDEYYRELYKLGKITEQELFIELL